MEMDNLYFWSSREIEEIFKATSDDSYFLLNKMILQSWNSFKQSDSKHTHTYTTCNNKLNFLLNNLYF